MHLASIGDSLESVVQVLNTWIWATPESLPWLTILLMGTGVFLTLRMGFIQFRKLRHALQIVRGKYDDPDDAGDISHFQALATALSATVGIGNIAGVAIAIHFGGPGAVFWMWMTALLGMCVKYTEVSLAMKHRDFDDAGNSSGGPQKYIVKGLGPAWKPMAVFFAFCAILSSFGAGNMAQINTLADAVHTNTGLSFPVIGGLCAAVVGVVILGGIHRIGKVTSVLMPLMAIIYVTGALIVLGMNADKLGWGVGQIVSNAFDPTAGFAGTAAGVWASTFLWGVKRGLFSNEAGQGSAPIAHAAAKTDEPLREGLVALLEPFIDTILICTMTALVIICVGQWDQPQEQEIVFEHKDLNVYTWTGGETSLESFGVAAGRRGDDAVIEIAGFEGDHTDGTIEGATPADVTLVIANGRPTTVRHGGTATTPAILVINDAPLLMTEGQGIYKDGAPWSGEVTVRGGKITSDVAGIDIRCSMILTAQGLTASSFASSLGDFGNWIVTIAVILFALSTAISWSYYGDRATEFLVGIRGVMVYRLVFLGCVYLGAILPLKLVWDLGDLALGLMTIPNLIAVFFLSGQVRAMQDDYFSRKHEPND